MKVMIQFVAVLSCLLFSGACTTESNYTADNLPTEQLHFGRVGGFTGATINYILVDSGQLFKGEAGDTIEEIGRIPQAEAKTLLERAQDLDWANAPSLPPGNINNVLIYHTAQGEVFKLSWSRADLPSLQKFTDLQRDLLAAFQAQADAAAAEEK